jgi:uncharacterized membrane protein
MIIIANILVSIIAANHLFFAYEEFSGRNKADFYNKFEIKIAEGQDLAQIGRIVTNAAIFNALIALGLIVSLVWSFKVTPPAAPATMIENKRYFFSSIP